MPWCPKCGTEYRDEFKTCNDCNSVLVDMLEHLDENASPEYDKETFLISVGDSFEADMVEALLNANGVPVLKKYKEAGDYLKIYMGGTNFGVDIFVPSKLLSKAQDIIENSKALNDEEELQAVDWEAQCDEHQGEEPEGEESEGEELESEVLESEEPQNEETQNEEAENEEVPRGDFSSGQQVYDKKLESTEKADTARAEEAYNRTRRIRTWIILLLFVPGEALLISAWIN